MSGWTCVASCLIRFCVEALLAKAAFLSRGQGHLAAWTTLASLVCCNVLPAKFCLLVIYIGAPSASAATVGATHAWQGEQ